MRAPDLRDADPPRWATAVAAAQDALDTADQALEAAASRLGDAIEATRRASANASTGDALDAARFDAAGAAANAAADPVDAAAVALRRLASRCSPLDLDVPQLEVTGARATSAGQQIENAAGAAAGFIAFRADAALVLDELATAAAALDHEDAATARASADRAATAHQRIEPLALALPELRLWLETTNDLIGAVGDAARALDDGDAAAADAARARLRDAAGEAPVSDRALALATSEGASRVVGLQLQQLAALARAVADAQDALRPVRAGLLARSASGEAP